MAPALKLFGSAQTRFFPEQRLLLKAIAMFLTEPQGISQSNLHQIGLLIPNPEQPAHAGITVFVRRMRAHDPDNRHIQPTCVFDMYLLPPRELDGAASGILPLELSIRAVMGHGIVGLQFGPILAWRSSLASGWGSGAVKTAIALEAYQRSLEGQAAALTPQPGRVVSAIQNRYRRGRQQGNYLLQLRKGHLRSRRLRADALLIEHIRPTAGCLWQGHHRRKVPAKGDRFLTFGQIMHIQGTAIR